MEIYIAPRDRGDGFVCKGMYIQIPRCIFPTDETMVDCSSFVAHSLSNFNMPKVKSVLIFKR